MTCDRCSKWVLKAQADKEGKKLKGCLLWNRWKHENIPHSTTHITYEKAIQIHGPSEYYEGWVKGSVYLINNSIITDKNSSCDFFTNKKE